LTRVDANGGIRFVHADPPQVEIELTGQASHAIVAVIRR